MTYITESELRAIKSIYKIGSTVKATNKKTSVEIFGVVKFVDKDGNIHIDIGDGKTYIAEYNIDKCKVINKNATIDSVYNFTD